MAVGNYKKNIFLFSIIIFFLASCQSLGSFENTTAFPKHEWPSSQKVQVHFKVTDTAAFYNIFVVIRHTGAYHFNNIWLNLSTKNTGDTLQTQQLNLPLANNSQGWLGTYFDDIIENRVQVNAYPMKLKAGEYDFTLQQTMREDPLQEIMNAGIRIEKNSR